MDDKLRGRKVKVIVDEIVKDTIRMSEDIVGVDNEDFYDYGFERLLDFVMENGRASVTYRLIENHSKKLMKEAVKKEKKTGKCFIDELCRRFSEDNDGCFEVIRERLQEKLEETDFDDMSKRDWKQEAAIAANGYFWDLYTCVTLWNLTTPPQTKGASHHDIRSFRSRFSDIFLISSLCCRPVSGS